MNRYLEIIKEKIPHLIIEKYSFNNEGQNNDVVVINDEYIFKFPKYPEGIEKLRRETDILSILNKQITLDIPNPIYSNLESSEVGNVYSGYKMIKGVSLRRDKFIECQRKDIISEQLAVFLKELHSILVQEVDNCKIKNIDNHREWSNLYERIEEKLFPYMKKESRDMVSGSFNNFLRQNLDVERTLIHGDFGPSNILYDLESGRVSGIIDFNEVSIGDPAVDVASLMGPFGYGEDFVRSFKPVYPDIDKLIERARFYSSTFALQEALFGIEVGDKEAFAAGIKEYL